MAICHECDSQVAEIDVFCPFCGISLEPISLDDEFSNVNMEQTVFMAPLPKAVNLTPQPDVVPVVEEKAAPDSVEEVDPAEAPTVMQAEYPTAEEIAASALQFDSGKIPESAPESLDDVPVPELLRHAADEKIETPSFAADARSSSVGEPSHEDGQSLQNENIDSTVEQNDDLDALIKAHTGGIEAIPIVKSQEIEEPVSGPADDVAEPDQEKIFDTPEFSTTSSDEPLSNLETPPVDDFAASESDAEKEPPSTGEIPAPANPWDPGSTNDIYASIPEYGNRIDLSSVEKQPSEDQDLIRESEISEPDANIDEDVPKAVEMDFGADRDRSEFSDPYFPPTQAVEDNYERLDETPAHFEDNFHSPVLNDSEMTPSFQESEPAQEIPVENAPELARPFADLSPAPQVAATPEIPKVITNDIVDPSVENKSPVASGSISPTSSVTGTGDGESKKASLKPLSEGTILNNRYEIVRKIGGGGMGAVYLALDKNLGGVHRAVKEMVQSHIEEDQQQKAIDDFKRESMILSTLDHPSIPTIYDYFYDEPESRFYLVMKYIAGGDLASRLRSAPGGRIDERTVTEWAVQVTDVLAYLHGLPTTIVYRDLKPSNVMLDGNTGRVMLIDFGIARSINQKQEKGVTAVGTMGYAPPELFSGNVEPRSDIYSLGSTMFHLLTGADPQSNPLLIFDFQKNPRPRQINPQLSDQMERILMRSVEYNADARFLSADEMRQVLADHLENLKRGSITYGVTEVPDSVSLANQSVFCGFCGQRIVATDLFCAFCGAKQPIAQQGVHSEIYSRAMMTAKLVIDGTSELDAPVFSLEKNENLVGRRDPMSNIFPEVDLSKYDPQTKISRRHARIWADGGNYLVEDLGSSNGTILLAGMSDSLRLLPHTPHTLASGDRIRVGDTTLHFLVG